MIVWPVLVVCWSRRTGDLYVGALRRLGDDRQFDVHIPPFHGLRGLGPGREAVVLPPLIHDPSLCRQGADLEGILCRLRCYGCQIVIDDLDRFYGVSCA